MTSSPVTEAVMSDPANTDQRPIGAKVPPLLTGAALVFWGAHSDFLGIGVLMAVVLESALILKDRWDFADEDFTRIWTFCSLLLLAATLYAFTANDTALTVMGFLQNPNYFTQRNAGNSSARAVAGLLQWLPMIFFPFMAASRFSTREGVPLRTVSLILQRRWKKASKSGSPLPPSPSVNISYAFICLCLFSASIHSSEDSSFFWGFSALVAWALWPLRSRRFHLLTWGAAVLTVVLMGYFGQRTIGGLQRYLGNLNPQLFSGFSRRGFDPRQTHTSIGNLSRNKLSGKIIIRIQAKDGLKVPPLLREASYRFYRGGIWSSINPRNESKEFQNIFYENTNSSTWLLTPARENSLSAVTISCYLQGGAGLLPLPRGAAQLDRLHAYTLHQNALGTVMAIGPGLVIFDALYGPGVTNGVGPEAADTGTISSREANRSPSAHSEAAALDRTLDRMQIRDLPADQALRAMHAYFQTNFTYSTSHPGNADTNDTPLVNFLEETHSGHCEYFASATVLLLRRMGIPARYTVGYAVHEPAGDGKFVVRQRDAHAWCQVWNKGRWQDFDTTPGVWLKEEAKDTSSALQKLSDFWSRITYEFSKIRWGQSNLRQYLLWGSMPVFILLLAQIIFRRRRRQRRDAAVARKPEWPGLDSEFYEIEQKLARRGLPRRPSESITDWLRRALADPGVSEARNPLEEALRLHYRYRFDPAGLQAEDRALLRRKSEACLTTLTKK